ncbi:hypothetical protein CI109_103588 [Kwoniella shandongensis]|uniref:Uncharacterized protein n=1 Tax=Kwoniella shandongensis TaxID=1734106 RepID=A0A5M6C7M5_9TREE|nr:uncharacterized protein CI109_000720 [Kwoniella shandongensis]KAA5531148.1 hypothetical protein CI109_000720 [Kwoniella shandongensis]
MASTWDIISAGLFLAIFLGVVYAATKFSNILQTQSSQTQSSLSQKGVTYNSGRLSVTTDRAPPTREEYINNMQGAFERSAKNMKAHANAFTFGSGSGEKNGAEAETSSTPDKKGFRRTKKLD